MVIYRQAMKQAWPTSSMKKLAEWKTNQIKVFQEFVLLLQARGKTNS